MGGDTKNIHATVGTESRFTPSSIFYCFLWRSLMPKLQNFTLLIYTPQSWLIQISFKRGFTITLLGGCESFPKSPSPVDGTQAWSMLCCISKVQKRLRTDVSCSFQAVSVDPPQVRTLHFPRIEILTFHGCAWALVYCQWVINTTLRNCNKAATTIEDVESCRNYTFAVRCALSEAPWSSWSHETTVLTQLNSETKKRLQITQIYCRSR